MNGSTHPDKWMRCTFQMNGKVGKNDMCHITSSVFLTAPCTYVNSVTFKGGINVVARRNGPLCTHYANQTWMREYLEVGFSASILNLTTPLFVL